MSREAINIPQNIINIRKRIEQASKKSGRIPSGIKIAAITKNVSISDMKEAISAGLTNLGENRVQEFLKKYDNIGNTCEWHFIGHLQTNKVKYVIDKISLLHSLDSVDLALEIQKRAEKIGKVLDILIEVNVSGEQTKFGVSPKDLDDFILQIKVLKNISIKGLMTVAPYSDNPEDTRPVFRQLNEIFVDINGRYQDNISMQVLSMGMSNDFEIAIEEGSSIVRIGTSIFKESSMREA